MLQLLLPAVATGDGGQAATLKGFVMKALIVVVALSVTLAASPSYAQAPAGAAQAVWLRVTLFLTAVGQPSADVWVMAFDP